MADMVSKHCFVICPIGEPGSEERAWSDDILRSFIEPVANEFGYEARRAIDESRPGEITTNMIADIINADLVVADLTFHNANVFYELAVRHARGTPFVHVAKINTKIPFDISTINTIFIDRSTFAAVDKSRADLRAHFRSISDQTASFDNPVKRFQQKLQADQTGDPIAKRLLNVEEQVATLARESVEAKRPQKLFPMPSRFETVNSQVTRQIHEEMRQLLLGNRFKLIFNPISGASKTITFLEDGSIGEGRNQNESTWRIADGMLEILQSDNTVHSRFIYVGNNKAFYHAGGDLPSIKGQSIVLEQA